MVLNFTKIFNFNGPTKHRPLLNQIPVSITDNASSSGISSKLIAKNNFWKWFKTRPELNSPVSIRVDDTISAVEFFKPDGTPLGTQGRNSANKFWNENFLYDRLKSFQYDRLTTGSGFLWMGMLTKDQLRTVSKKMIDKFWYRDVSMRTVAKDLLKRAIDEDLRLPRVVDYIASSTVQIEHNKHDITAYIQWFGAENIRFLPKEVIHVPLHRVDGKVDGFTPVESLMYEVILIWAIKENMLSYFRNGGSPSKAWILPEELANSENHRWLIQELMNRGAVENRHSNLVFTGKVEIENLESDIKDMDYKELALYVTSNIAYALRVPVSRIPYMIGSSQSKGDGGGMAESGYWSMIESDQITIEQAINTQLFNKLGFMIRFKKRYKIDDLREAQALNFTVDAVGKMSMELAKEGKMLTDEKMRCFFNLSANDVREMTPEEKMDPFQQTGKMNQSFAKDNQVLKNPTQQQNADTKRKSAVNNPKNNNQTGS